MLVSLTSANTLRAARFLLRGHVQGIGVRPAVARLATSLQLNGSVSNRSTGVEIVVEGEAAGMALFADRLIAALPLSAIVETFTRVDTDVAGLQSFQIEPADLTGRLATFVPRDLAVCDDCLREVATTADRRHGYAFTSCTNCGPRFSIIEAMPYERGDTSMSEFALCAACQREYEQPSDRRFHAQTNACPDCGPRISTAAVSSCAEVIGQARDALREGGIVAMKGVGGYQLLCDATSAEAVARLRQLKQRRSKPLAVMLEESMLGDLHGHEHEQFHSPRNAIVLVLSSCVTGLAANVSAGLNTVGIMKPTTPLHWRLLAAVGRPLVVTSGNIDGEPLAYEDDSGRDSIRRIADVVLHHNRRIVRPIDDSVVRCIAGRVVTIRAARGIAPLPLKLHCDRQILAVGGHQKSSVAICNGTQSILGPHIGDLDSIATRERFVEQSRELMNLYGVEPEVIAHDQHPDYFTTRWAEEQNLPMIAVQHHHAHVVAGMVEHGWLDRTALGVAFDGTGFGADGTIWGGEFLLATACAFERVASIRPFHLIGGEHAIRQPSRIAQALVLDSVGTGSGVRFVAATTGQNLNSPQGIVTPSFGRDSLPPLCARLPGSRTSSMGRLFDGVASIILDLNDCSFEGQPAMMLEAACDWSAQGEYPIPCDDSGSFMELDWRPLIRELLSEKTAGASVGAMAMKFHRTVAAAVAAVAGRFVNFSVVLCGGCFQNKVLTELVHEQLARHPSPVGLPGIIPPNDGGLAAGQLAVASARLRVGQ